MHKLKIIIDSNEQKLDELLRTCRMISEQASHKPGCMESSVSHAKNDTNRIFFKQHWIKSDQLDDYFRSDHFSALLGALGFLGKNYKIIINNGTPKEGNLAVEKARNPII